jgi:phosphoglycolate phosphatase
VKLVVFDCDGTLVDSQHMIVAAMERAFAIHNKAPPPRETILSVVGLSLPFAIERLEQNLDAGEIGQLSEDYKAAFAELRRDPRNAEPLYPGMLDIIKTLAQREDVLLGIATGKSRRGVAQILVREALGEYFHTIQTADTHPSKPDPSMLRTAMADAGCSAQDTIMIGDTTFDIDMARAAGVEAVGVSWGYHPLDALTEAGAAATVTDAAALKLYLDRFAGR